jgi:hypothetical protein
VRDSPQRKSSIKKGSGGDDWMASAWMWSPKSFWPSNSKRTQDMRSNHVDEITEYKSLLMGLQAIGQNKGWKVQQLVFVGGTCGSVHVESFNSNMKALGVLEGKWDLIRRKLVPCLLEEQDKVLRSYFAQRGGMRRNGRSRHDGNGRDHVGFDVYM